MSDVFRTPASRPLLLLVDLVCVVIFAAIGRASHDENPLLGLLHTAWPFALAALVAWAVLAAARWDAARWWPSYVLVWLASAWGGLLLRHLVGQGVRWPFPVVATITLGIMLALGRLVVRLVSNRRGSAIRVRDAAGPTEPQPAVRVDR